MKDSSSFNYTEQEAREKIIRLIDTVDIKKNTSYQTILNKFSLTPYIYECDEIEPIFDNYKTNAISKVNKFVLHPFQLKILNELKKGTNLIVSAPTSFGKTASVFEYINYIKNSANKILIILPTIALRNEYLEKINNCLNEQVILTSCINIENYDSFCMILTHEKFVEYFSNKSLDSIEFDFLVIDEIYKLQNESNSERLYSMSLAYLTALKISKQYIFLGPFIKSANLPDLVNYKILRYEYSPIAIDMDFDDVFDFESAKNEIKENEKTLVYFSNKNDIIKFAEFLDANKIKDFNYNVDLVNYIKEEYGNDWINEWSIIKALKNGVGIHYNELPSFIKEYVIDSYNNSNNTMLLLATSTLLEGVNTSTKKIIITSNKIGTNKLSDFEFWNLAGRAGRLGKYKVGKVLYYGDKDDFKKENRYIDLDNLWINEDKNIDEYELINKGILSDEVKQKALDKIMKKYFITLEDIKYLLLPFFSKIDLMIDFFDVIYPSLISEIKNIILDSKENNKNPSRKIRNLLFENYIKKYKKLSSVGPLPYSKFNILSNGINMANKTKTAKVKFIVKYGREIQNKNKISGDDRKIAINNLYNYSFYMVNNYIENSYIPGILILKLIINNGKVLSCDEYDAMYNYIFKQVEAFQIMVHDDELYETLGIITPLKIILKKILKDENILNISDLKKAMADKSDLINKELENNSLCLHYYKLLLKKFKI